MAEEKSKGSTRATLGNIALLILGAVVGALVNHWFDIYNGRLRHLTYYAVVSDALISLPDLGANSFQFLVDGKPVENVSQVSIFIQNDTDEDFGDVPVHITFTTAPSQMPKFISSNIVGPTDGITADKPPPYSAILTTKTATVTMSSYYTIKVLNRSDKPIYRIDFLFEGNVSPPVDVSVQMKGVDIQRRDLGQKNVGYSGLNYWVVVTVNAVCIVIFAVLFNYLPTILDAIARKFRKREEFLT